MQHSTSPKRGRPPRYDERIRIAVASARRSASPFPCPSSRRPGDEGYAVDAVQVTGGGIKGSRRSGDEWGGSHSGDRKKDIGRAVARRLRLELDGIGCE